MKAERIGLGIYRVTRDGRHETVYVAGSGDRRRAFWKGQVFDTESTSRASTGQSGRHVGALHITAPMPATVLKLLAAPGQTVATGDTLVIIEAMKMELPLRAPADGVVTAVRCREGELVAPDTVLVELE